MSDIKNIVDNLENSVLVLGPGIILEKGGKSCQAGFAERYVQNNKGLIKHYFEDDNLIRPKNALTLLTMQRDFASFYETDFPKKVLPLYRKIAQIPYPLVISLNPDETMVNCYKELGLEGQFVEDYYVKGKKNLNNQNPTKENPYLYNLFGSCKDPGSLILTCDDLFEFLQNLLPGNDIPTTIKTFLQNAKNITFLGVEFDRWYFQLLVKLLTAFDIKYETLRYAAPDLSSHQNINCICENNFEITFVGPDVFSFINELHYHCFKHEKNPLRSSPFYNDFMAFNPEIFISYKDDSESEKLVENLVEKGKENALNLINYKDQVEYRGGKWDFMKRLGWGKYVIVILSDDYFKSEYCMFEFKEIMDKGWKFEERVFPVIMSDEIVKGANWAQYEKYWKEELENLKVSLKDMDSAGISETLGTIKRHEEIIRSIPRMKNFISNTICLKYSTNQIAFFNPLFASINKKIENDLRI
jgi:hypothetical protein